MPQHDVSSRNRQRRLGETACLSRRNSMPGTEGTGDRAGADQAHLGLAPLLGHCAAEAVDR
eukprot:1840675-Rhodomonas_salina.2